jgi:anaerobic selenocysteine-containing dehydrogenase
MRRASEWSFAAAASVADIDPSIIAELAERYAHAAPAVIRCGWGLERNRNGGSAVAAVLALPAVAGKFGVRGGGYTMSNSGAWQLDPTDAAREPEPPTRHVNMNRLGAALSALDDPPVRVLFVYNCNPLATLPRQAGVLDGLLREDLFTIVFDQVLTDTGRYADVLLPATTFLEHHELRAGFGAYFAQLCGPVVEPLDEARSNYGVFAELCRRTGVAQEGDPESAAELTAALLAAQPPGDSVAAMLAAGGRALPEFGDRPVQFVDVFPRTADGKIHLVPGSLDQEAGPGGGLYAYRRDPGGAAYPLALISPASKRTISSTLGQLRSEQVALALHPSDAAARGIEKGDRVRIFNDLGEVVCLLTISRTLRPGVAYLPKGLWCHNTLNGNTGNVLVPDSLTDIGGGACFNDARVEVERLA